MPSLGADDLDVFFQPALTWILEPGASKGATQAVALFFLEYDPNGDQTDDFARLVKGLVRWAWTIAGGARGGITPSDVTTVIDTLDRADPIEPVRLIEFLAEHFRFRIRLHTGTAQIQGTVLPMLPGLSMSMGSSGGRRTFGHAVPADEVAARQQRHDELKPPPGMAVEGRSLAAPASTTNEPQADPEPDRSLLWSMLSGYARILIDAGLDTLEQKARNPDSVVDTHTIATAMGSLRAEPGELDPFVRIARMGSRFLLHGLDVEQGTRSPKTTGLYDAIGQQFPLERAKVENESFYRIRLKRIALTPPPGSRAGVRLPEPDQFIQLGPPSGETLEYRLDADDRGPLGTMRTALDGLAAVGDDGSAPFLPPIPRIEPMPAYRLGPRLFALRDRLSVELAPAERNDDGELESLHPLPATLIDHLAKGTDPASIVLEHWPGGRHAEREPIDPARRRWVTLIELDVEAVAGPDADGSQELYDVAGTGPVDQGRLLALWQRLEDGEPETAMVLSVLRATDASTLTEVATATTEPRPVLVRANLATDSPRADISVFAASLGQPKDFLQLLWEATDQRGDGFYLAVPRREGEQPATRLTVMVRSTDPNAPMRANDDAVIVDSTVGYQPETDLIVASGGPDDLVPILAVPADSTGFETTVGAAAPPTSDNPDGAAYLRSLYQMMGWQIEGQRPGPAIGPTRRPMSSPADPDRWSYEKVVNDAALGGPPAMGDPVPIHTWWVDVYGNRLPTGTETPFPFRASEPLISVGQWPSVVEEYRFLSPTTDGGLPTIKIILRFATATYTADADADEGAEADEGADARRDQRLAADRDLYRLVRAQLANADASLTTTLDTTWTAAVDVDRLRAFVDRIIGVLDGDLDDDASIEEKIPVVPTTAINPPTDEFTIDVTTSLVLTRSLDLVADDLKDGDAIKPEHREVIRTASALAPQRSATGTGLDPGAELHGFAESFEASFPGLVLSLAANRSDDASVGFGERSLHAVRLGPSGVDYAFPGTETDRDETDRDMTDRDEDERAIGIAPVTYALPPLANTLLSGEVEIPTSEQVRDWRNGSITIEPTRFDGVDLNVPARDFLVALESLLRPATLATAYRVAPQAIAGPDGILRQKVRLASAISDDITNILERDDTGTAGIGEAKEALRQELLDDLVVGYEIETIVQYRVDLTGSFVESEPPPPWEANPPRLRGQVRPTDRSAAADPDQAVAAVLSLDGDPTASEKLKRSWLTYLFDTKTPEAFTGVARDLEFVPTELEVDLADAGIAKRQTSRFLRPILQAPEAKRLGSWPIPIPLRYYPTPPSLLEQEAGPDEDSRSDVVAEARQWQYAVLYEHRQIAQDSVDVIVQINSPTDRPTPTAAREYARPGGLFDALLRFRALTAEPGDGLTGGLAKLDLPDLADRPDDDVERQAAVEALNTFAGLAADIADGWSSWKPLVVTRRPTVDDLHYEIGDGVLPPAEDPDTGQTTERRQVTITVHQTVASVRDGSEVRPEIELVGFVPGTPTSGTDGQGRETITTIFTRGTGPTLDFGDSTIPDRWLKIENLDLLEHQNAWASVWLSRNRQLLSETTSDEPTNPAFVFQTPAVRFSNPATPFLTNDEPYDIAFIPDPDDEKEKTEENDDVEEAPVLHRRDLADHLIALVRTLFPKPSRAVDQDTRLPEGAYKARFSCRYGYSPARGRGLNEDIRIEVPVFLGLAVTAKDLEADDSYATAMATEIGEWRSSNRPETDEASLVFSVDLFSNVDTDTTTGLPTLRIATLSLRLDDITDW